MLQTSLLLVKCLNKTETHFLIRSVFFVSKGNSFDSYAHCRDQQDPNVSHRTKMTWD